MKEIRKTIERRKASVEKEKTKAAKEKERDEAPTKTEYLFINADTSDKELIAQLLKVFEDRPDWIAAGPLFEGSTEDITKDLDANLVDCQALILVYGNAAAPWVRAQLRRYSKMERLRETPPRVKTILLGPPAPKPEIAVSGGFSRLDFQNGLTGRHCRTDRGGAPAVTGDPSQRAPYPGLRAFRRDETDLFFGREDCINAMVDRLAATHFLAVLGSSGTGKSSLVKTGLLDALELGLLAQAGSRWRIAEFRPGGAPLRNLARGLLEAERDDEGTHFPDQDVDLLRALLARGPRSVIEWCARTPAEGRQPAAAGRPVRGAVPLPVLCRARGGRGFRGAAARKRARNGRADLRRHHHAVRISRRLLADRGPLRRDQRGPVPDAAHDARAMPRGDRRPGGGLRFRDRAGAGQPAAQRSHRLRDLGRARRQRPARPHHAARRSAPAPAIHAQPDVAAGARAIGQPAHQLDARRLCSDRRTARRA